MEWNRRHQPGQSIVLLAIMLVVIIAMVGLAVDVGHAYAEQRRVQSIVNAGALAGMHQIVSRSGTLNKDVWDAVRRAMTGNRVENADPAYTYRVDYILGNGTVNMLGEWNGSQDNVINGSGKPPAQIERVQVTMTETMDTYFARVVNRNTLTVGAYGVACIGDYGNGVYPIGIPIKLRAPTDSQRGHEVYEPGSTTPLPPDDPRWGNWWGTTTNMEGLRLRLPVTNKSVDTSDDDYIPGVHVAWLDWGGHSQTGPDGVQYKALNLGPINTAWTIPGTMQNGFLEGQAFDETNNTISGSTSSERANRLPMQRFQIGDWIAGTTGAHASIENQLSILKAKQTLMLLPFYDFVGSEGSAKLSVHTINMGAFVVTDYKLTGSPKWVEFEFRGAGTASAQGCSGEGVAGWTSPDGTTYEKTFSIVGQAKVNQVSRKIIKSGTTFDIVLVVDTSDTMKHNWANKANNNVRPRLEDVKDAVRNFVRKFDISTNGDPDARIALVHYRGSTTDGNLSVQTIANFQPACTTQEQIKNNCGGENNKWSSIQTGVGSLSASGRVPGPIALENIETLLKNKRVPEEGKQYQQVVIMVSGSVFNVCGTEQGQNACPYGQLVPAGNQGNKETTYYTNAPYNMLSGRPIWQAQRVASRIRSTGAQIYVVALTPLCTNNSGGCFDPNGMAEISNSGTDYYRAVTNSDDFFSFITQTRERIEATARAQTFEPICVPQDVWTPTQGIKVTLTQPNNPSWSKQTVTDSSGNYTFGNLAAGQYVLKVEPLTLLSSDGKTYTYSRLRNGYNLSEEEQASVYISPQYADGTPVHSELWLSLPSGGDGTPLNACTAP